MSHRTASKIEILLDVLRSGKTSLEDYDVEVLTRCVLEILVQPQYAEMIANDYPFLRPALMVLGIHDRVLRNREDFRPLDLALLDALGFHLHQEEQDQRRLADRIGGLWRIIRGSSNNPNRYEISVLNVKPLVYSSDREIVNTYLSHFSMHIGVPGMKLFQSYSGQVIAEGENIHFLGNRDDLPKFFTMTWKNPFTFQRDGISHVDAARGVITASNADGITISTPIIAQYLIGNDQRNQSRSVFSSEAEGKRDDLLRKAIDSIGTYERDELITIISDSGLATYEDLLQGLQSTIESGDGKFFKI